MTAALTRTARKAITILALLAGLGGIVFWLASAPRTLSAAALPDYLPKPEKGELLYHAGGCISCHKPPEGQAGSKPALPSGGHPFNSPIGVLYPPNLTPDARTGLGKWSNLEFVNAMMRGVSPGGQHYIPAFPYTSYAKMRIEDVLDLKAYLDALPAVQSPDLLPRTLSAAVLRRGVGIWKWLGFDTRPVIDNPTKSKSWNRGAYLVNGPGHCGECHTPRNLLMVSDGGRLLAGAPHPVEEGKVRSLRGLVARGRYKDVNDLVKGFAFYNEEMDPGGMGSIQENLQKLPVDDLAAIAEYLLSLE